MRRKGHAGHENHERWLVSYADFITLLFAFFVVMFASTQNDKTKAKAISDSVREALEHGEFSNAISTVLGRGKHEARKPPITPYPARQSDNEPPPPGQGAAKPANLAQSFAALQVGLASELKAGKLEIRMEERGLIVSLRESAFFASGDDTVSPASLSILAKVAAVVANLPNPVRLEGHTDAVPIHNSRFRSNWELSAARGIAMLEILAVRFGIPRHRMAIAGYADVAPVDTNDTEEGRGHNRRVDLVLLSVEGVRSEPGPQQPKTAARKEP